MKVVDDSAREAGSQRRIAGGSPIVECSQCGSQRATARHGCGGDGCSAHQGEDFRRWVRGRVWRSGGELWLGQRGDVGTTAPMREQSGAMLSASAGQGCTRGQ
jgi:hypothetical protein